MARRRRGYWAQNLPTLGDRSTLGPALRAAIDAVYLLHRRTVEGTVTFSHTLDEVLTWLVPDDVRAKLTAARPYAEERHRSSGYDILGGHLMLDFDKPREIPMLLPRELTPDLEKAKPLMEVTRNIERINREFAIVRHVLLWLDANATPGAIRHYWPSIRALVPTFTGDEAGRFVEPQGISVILPLIRETCGIMANAMLLPSEVQPRDKTGMYLHYAGEKNIKIGDITVPSYDIGFNIGA